MSKNKIKKPPLNQGKHIKVTEDKTVNTNLDYPVFCLKHISKQFDLNNCTDDEKLSFIDRLVLLSQNSWIKLQLSPRHGLGSEKISRNSIKSSIPNTLENDSIFLSDDSFLLAFRFQGKKAMIGYRNESIFHILFIDNKFEVYKH